MSVYNGELYLRDSIASMLQQTFEDFEFLIINDGSTDSTEEIVRSYSDSRIKLINNGENLGLAKSLNKGLAIATGNFVARQDADDTSERERLERQIEFLKTHKDVLMLGTMYNELDSHGKVLWPVRLPAEYTEIRWALLFFCPFVHSSVMLRRTALLENVGNYDESFRYSMDYDLWLRIALRHPVSNLDEFLVNYRQTPHSMTSTMGERTLEGYSMRVARVTKWLSWDTKDWLSNETRFNKIINFLFGLGTQKANLNEINDISSDILDLQREFSTFFQLTKEENEAHRKKVCDRIAERRLSLIADL